jgi:hypothetical protein
MAENQADLSALSKEDLQDLIAQHEAQPTLPSDASAGAWSDFGQSLASGAVHTALGSTLGIPGTIQELAEPAMQAMGGVPYVDKKAPRYPRPEEISKGIGELTGYKEYEPKYESGRVAKAAVGNALPAMLGPEALSGSATKAMASALKYGLVPAAAGEGAAELSRSQLGEDPTLQATARLAGSLTPTGLRGLKSASPALTGKDISEHLPALIGAGLGAAAAKLSGHGEGALLSGLWLGGHAGHVVKGVGKHLGDKVPDWALPGKFSGTGDPALILRALQEYQRPDPSEQ